VLISSRSLAGYRAMFALTDAELSGDVLDCAAGGASFIAELLRVARGEVRLYPLVRRGAGESVPFLPALRERVRDAGHELVHVDATVMLERPKLAPHRAAIHASLAAVVGSVNVKATTGEGMGFVGRGEGAAAMAIATLDG
jgi:2-C-methyl-D-erythritol 2,4-cyclodiphosphate synthase